MMNIPFYYYQTHSSHCLVYWKLVPKQMLLQKGRRIQIEIHSKDPPFLTRPVVLFSSFCAIDCY
jgi:hypothetical protein